jgi:putative DNA primase/helicase
MNVADHYERVGHVYAALGGFDGLICPGNHDFTGWYNTRDVPGESDGEGRAYALGKEFPAMRPEIDRTVYATTNYASKSWFTSAWERFDYADKRRAWDGGESPTPGYGDIRAYAPFADIDLTDEAKHKRPDGDAPRETVERALAHYAEAFAEMAGGMGPVHGLDSVGGAYLLIAPSATRPIGELTDREGRELIFDDMAGRLNEWLADVRDRVNKAVPEAESTFEADCVNNKNRPYKAPMSVHKSLDGVVTPVDPEAPQYDYTPLEAVDDDAIDAAETWAESFTSDHSAAVSAIVSTLWPEYYDEAGGWRDAVSARIEDLNEEREKKRKRERQDTGIDAADIPDDLDKTDDIDVVNAAIEAIDCRDVARKVADEWDTAPGRDPPRFNPPWRQSETGESCFATRDYFVDLNMGNDTESPGGPLMLAAWASNKIAGTPTGGLDAEQYWTAVAELRALGFEIPRYTGDDGIHGDALGLYDDPQTTDEERRLVLRAVRASKRA